VSEVAASRRGLIVEFTLLAGSTALFQATRLATGIVAAGLLAPREYAEWGLALAVLAYSVYGNAGITSGLNRELPRFLGQGNHGAAEAAERAALAGSLIAAGVTAGVVAGLAWVAGLSIGMIAAIALAAGVQQLYLFGQSVLRSRLKFNRASAQQAVLAIVFPLVGLGLLEWLGIVSLGLGQSVAYAVGAAFAGRLLWRRPHLDLEEIRRLARIGIPIMVAGLAFALLTTLDRWIVHVALGVDATGLYTIAALLSSSALLVSMVLAQQFYPRMAHMLGRGATSRSLLRVAMIQSGMVAGLVLPLSAGLIFGVPQLVVRLAPEYEASIPALQVLAIGFVPMVAASGFSNYLVVIGQSGAYLRAILGAIVTELIIAVQLTSLGLVGIAAAALAAYTYLVIATALLAFRAAAR
jgi:O-antigen/teichoic acid export membrane protein